VYTCSAGSADCDGNPANGCESLQSAQHCGACGSACAATANYIATCAAGVCGRVCPPGLGDCDGNAVNGCEADLNGTTHCGRCGMLCAAGQACVGGSCSSAPATTATLLSGLGGASGYGASCVHANDDGSWAGPPPAMYPAAPIPLAPAFPAGLAYAARSFTTFYVNNNGNITFGGGVGTYAPMAFPIADQPMIAPWWADVDTRGGGQPMRNNVCFAVEATRVVVTWHLIGYFSAHDNLQNSFQVVLSRPVAPAEPTDFDVEFRYNRCQWTTGDASGGSGGFGGTPAQAGFDFGDRRSYVALPYSRTGGVLNLRTTTNVGSPGVWRFRVRGGAVLPM